MGLENYTKDSGAAPREKTKENRLWSNIKTTFCLHNFVFWALTISVSVAVTAFGRKQKALAAVLQDLFWFNLILSRIKFLAIYYSDTRR